MRNFINNQLEQSFKKVAGVFENIDHNSDIIDMSKSRRWKSSNTEL